MTAGGLLLTAGVVAPLLLAGLALRPGGAAGLRPLLGFASLPALMAALLVPTGTMVTLPGLALVLALDLPGAILLGGSAILWSAAGFFAATSMAASAGRGFCAWWLMTLAGSLGVVLAADLVGFYLFFSLVSLAAYGLVVHERTPGALRAARIYMVLALVGEAALLLGLVLLAVAAGGGNPLIARAVAGLAASPYRHLALAALLLGFALKMGLVPLHVWLPLAHPAAPMPASAVLSGVVVKAGVIGLVRFLPFAGGFEAWGDLLAGAGLVTAFFGVAIGVTQLKPKTILAYSTVSQMGLVAWILGSGLAQADPAAGPLAALFALHHMLAKGALFMALGVIAAAGPGRLRPVLLLTAFLGLGLAGLPLSGGSLAKLATKPLADGHAIVALLVALSSVGSAMLMTVFVSRAAGGAAPPASSPALPADSAFARGVPNGLLAPWLVASAASVLAPWLLFATVTGLDPRESLMPSALMGSLWPIALGATLAWVVLRPGVRLPSVPEGDVIVAVEAPLTRLCKGFAALAERTEAVLARWETATSLLLALALLLMGATRF